MKKIILVLSLLFSLGGISLAFFFVFFNPVNLTEFLRLIILSIKPYHYSGMDIFVITEKTNEYSRSTSIDLINLFFYLSFLAGSIIYYFSKYKETKLLLFNYSLIFLACVIKTSISILHFNTMELSFYSIINISINLLYIIISYYFITKDLNIVEENPISNDIVFIENNLQLSSNYKRFVNLFIDSFIIITIVFGFISYPESFNNKTSIFGYFKNFFGDKFAALSLFYAIKFIYYLLFESILKSTPAKFLTSCYVTDDEGNSPTFSMILKRTLLRFVPFESFSFLMEKNIHDDYSDTYVINKKTDRTIENYYIQFLTIAFGILLVTYFCMSFKEILFPQ